MFGLRLSSAATSRFLRPATTSSTIRRSVSESSLSDAVRPPIRRSSARAFASQRRAPSRSNLSAASSSVSRASRLCCARRCTVPSASSVLASSSGFASCGGSGSHGRRLEHLDRLLMVSFRREQKPPGTVGERTEPGVGLSGVFVEQAQQPFRFGKVVDADERLDSDRARELGEKLVQLGDVREERGGQPPACTCVAAGELERRKGAGQPMDCARVPNACGDSEQVRNLSSRFLGFASVGVDLGQDHQTQRLAHLTAGLPCKLDPLFAKSRRHAPRAGRDLHSGEEHQVPDDPGISSLRSFRDQSRPDGARLLEAVGQSKQPRQRRPRVPLTAGGSFKLDGTFEQVSMDAAGTPEGQLGEGCEAGCELLRVGRLLREPQSRFRIANAIQVAFPCGGHPRKPAENVDLLADLEAGLGKCAVARLSAARNPSVSARTHARRLSASARIAPGFEEPTASSSSPEALTVSPANMQCSAALMRRRLIASTASAGVSATASSASSAAASPAPRARACAAPASRASATSSSGPVAAIAR